MSNLITKYRPGAFGEVIGQGPIVRSLEQMCKKKDVQTYILSGPSGCGKTTLSRIVAKQFGVEDNAILDHDAASKTGVEDMRQIQEIVQYRPFGGSGMRAIVIDECHRLSGNAWDSLLKILEEPPKHVLWFFCTTNPAKIPKTVKTRGAHFELKAVSDKDLTALLEDVEAKEKIRLPDDVFELLVTEAKGSPRQLLSNMAVARTAKDKKEAAALLKTAVEDDKTLELCRFIANGNGSWDKCMLLLKKLEGENPESIRIVVSKYLAACAKGAKNDKGALAFLGKLEAFSVPYNGADDQSQLILSIGRALFAQ